MLADDGKMSRALMAEKNGTRADLPNKRLVEKNDTSEIGDKKGMKYELWLKCEMCESSFQTNKGLKNHVSSVHKGKKPLLKCVICAETAAWHSLTNRNKLCIML